MYLVSVSNYIGADFVLRLTFKFPRNFLKFAFFLLGQIGNLRHLRQGTKGEKFGDLVVVKLLRDNMK